VPLNDKCECARVKKSKENKLQMGVWGRGIEGSLRVYI
jgi:hypothetical protein